MRSARATRARCVKSDESEFGQAKDVCFVARWPAALQLFDEIASRVDTTYSPQAHCPYPTPLDTSYIIS